MKTYQRATEAYPTHLLLHKHFLFHPDQQCVGDSTNHFCLTKSREHRKVTTQVEKWIRAHLRQPDACPQSTHQRELHQPKAHNRPTACEGDSRSAMRGEYRQALALGKNKSNSPQPALP